MAKIPDLSTQERPTARIGGGGTPGPSQGPALQSDAVVRGTMALAQDVERGLEDITRAVLVEEDRANTLRAEEAFTKLRERQLDLSIGDNGFHTLKGSAAVTRPLMKEWGKYFDDAQREIEGTLANDDQRLKYKNRAGVARLQFNEDILRHLAREGDTYAKEVYDGTIAGEQRQATARWDSPNDVGASLERIRAAVAQRADRYGWAPEYRDAELQRVSSQVHSAVIMQALATGDYRYAQKWYEAHRNDVDLNTAKQLERAVEQGTQKEIQDRYNTEYLANENNPKALEALRKDVLGNKVLGEDRRNMLVGRIQNRQFVLERRDEVEQSKRLRVIERGITEMNNATLAGFEPNAEQFAPILEAARGTELEPVVRQSIALANQTRAFRNAGPLEQERVLAEAEAGVRKEPGKFDIRVVQAWRQIHDAQGRQVKDSPISFAVQQGIIEPPMPLDLAQPATQGPALAERFTIARGVAARYGVPFKPLTAQEVSVLRTSLERSNVEQKRTYFGQLSQASGQDLQGYMAIMAQLAPDDPVTAIAGSHAGRGRAATADLMLRGQGILRPPTKGDGRPDGTGLIPMPPETDLRMRFDSYIREAFSGKAEARNAHYQASRAIYAALSVDAGDKDTKVLDADRWEQAMNLAIGPIAKYPGIGGRRIVLPPGYEYDQFRSEMTRRVQQLASSGRLDPSWTAERLRDLPLENIGDGRYVLKSGDGVVVGLPIYDRPVIRNKGGSISTERTITIEADGRHVILPTIVEGKQLSNDEAVKLWRSGKNKAVGSFATAAEAERAARARTEELGMRLAPVPIIIDFTVPFFTPSGEGLAPREDPTAAELAAAARPVTGRALPRPDRAKQVAGK